MGRVPGNVKGSLFHVELRRVSARQGRADTPGRRIKQRRTEIPRYRKSQEALAEDVGVTRATVSDWENDRYAPEGGNLANLARALDRTPEWIMRGAAEGATSESVEPGQLHPTFYQTMELSDAPGAVVRGSKHAGLGTRMYIAIREGRKHGWGADEYLAALERFRGEARELEDELFALHEELRRRDPPDSGGRDS
jgi:transcriptional regulator with XRE-family HTH domain